MKSGREFANGEFRTIAKNIVIISIILGMMSVMTLLMASSRTLLMFLGLAEGLTAVLILVIGLLAVRDRRRKFMDYIEHFVFCVEHTTKTAVLNYPDPMVVTTEEGAIQWYNSRFVSMVGRGNLFGEYVQDLFPQLQFSRFVEDAAPTPEEFPFKGNNYILTGSAVHVSQDGEALCMVGLYFNDMTEFQKLQSTFEEKKIVVCSVIIDNYDEVFKETPNASHGALLGDIERCVNQWVEKGRGISRRYERDKFIVFFEASQFELLLREKFSVLSEVKQINQGNKIPVTVSIGVGKSGSDLRENDKMARAALDMALGRGGDQAVMKTQNGFSFFGAKSAGVEKSTKVKARVVAHALMDLISHASRVIIMGHRNGDMDSFGAAVGLYRAVVDRKTDGYIAIDRNHNNVAVMLKSFMEQDGGAEKILSIDRALSLMDEHTLLIVVDTHRPSMVEYPEVLKRAKHVVLVDHHRRSEEFIEETVLTYHEPYASSSSEMVTEMLQYMSDSQTLSGKEAEMLYSGIYMDTKGFTFKTGVRTFEAAAYLRRAGVDPIRVRRLFRNDLATYIEKSKIISSAKVYRDNIAIAACQGSGKDSQIVVAQAADDLLNIKGIEAAFVLANVDNRIIISGRSLDTVNVQVILEKLGGGGHITIAGAQLENNSLAIAELKLRNAIDEVLYEE